MKTLKCDGIKDCKNPISHIDSRGFIYCEKHGYFRSQYEKCRKLKQNELKLLELDKPIKY